MKGAGRQLAIVGAALAVGLGLWVGSYVWRFGGLAPGVANLLIDHPRLATLAASGLHITSSELPSDVVPLALGDQRADLALTDLDGRTRHLSEWDGQRVVLNFWATWCHPCREEMPLFDALQNELGPQGVQVLGIGLDGPDKIRAWITAHPQSFPILLGQPLGYDVSKQFGNRISAVPYSVLIGPDGRLLRRHLGSFDSAGELRDWVLGGG
ncbi:MAG TPA: TlpA disulfide reductase family protein [Rhodanobacteraceae bacterium]|nr:TlpA disulfide reductase family protein [Rhodanobacteraceae bacterium]